MPYIKQDDRIKLDDDINSLNDDIASSGELNYVITRLVDSFCKRKGGNYEAYNSGIGVLESAKQEFYIRRVVPYESNKAHQNGDVYLD